MSRQPEMDKETFLGLVARLGLPGNEERLDALYQDVRTLLVRLAPLQDVDTSGVEPSPINPWLDWPEGAGGGAA